MRSIKKLLAFVMAVSFLGLMSFTFTFDQSVAAANQLNSVDYAAAAADDVEGKWRKARTIKNDDGSITTVYKCVKSGNQCVVGTIAKVTIWPVGD